MGTSLGKPRIEEKLNGENLRAKIASIAFDILDQWSFQWIIPSWIHQVNDIVRKSVQVMFTIKS